MNAEKREQITLPVEAMRCGGCSSKGTKKAKIEFDPARTGRERLVGVITGLGYSVPAEAETAIDPICGMTVSTAAAKGGTSEYKGTPTTSAIPTAKSCSTPTRRGRFSRKKRLKKKTTPTLTLPLKGREHSRSTWRGRMPTWPS